MPDNIESIAKGQLEAYNDRDFNKFVSLVTPDFVFNEMPTGRVINGTEEFRLIWDTWTTAFPDNHGQILNTFSAGNKVVIELSWSGTHKGPLVTPDKEFPATGNKFSKGSACQIIDVENGKVTQINHYFDILTIMNQLGLV